MENVMVPVYCVDENRRQKASTYMPRDRAQEQYEMGLADWNKKETVLILKKKAHEIHRPAQSLRPNFRVMFDFAVGKPYAIAIVEKWAFRA